MRCIGPSTAAFVLPCDCMESDSLSSATVGIATEVVPIKNADRFFLTLLRNELSFAWNASVDVSTPCRLPLLSWNDLYNALHIDGS